MPDQLLHVRRHPQDWQTAIYRMEDAAGFRWDTASGGVGRATSHNTVFCYVMCDKMVDGELAHSCSHGPPPHRIKVAVIKKLTEPEAYARAKHFADLERSSRNDFGVTLRTAIQSEAARKLAG